MKYKEQFDHLGRPHYTRDREGVFIVIGCIVAALVVWRWLA